MHELLLPKELLLGFHMVLIGDTAIHWADRRTLGFIVESHAFGAFIGYYIIDLIAYRFLYLIGIHLLAIGQYHLSGKGSAIAVSPFIGPLINCIVGALRLTSSAIDALICNNYSHNFAFLLGRIIQASLTLDKNKP